MIEADVMKYETDIVGLRGKIRELESEVLKERTSVSLVNFDKEACEKEIKDFKKKVGALEATLKQEKLEKFRLAQKVTPQSPR
jgi:hypothetical protein